jgi:hypothetical protein
MLSQADLFRLLLNSSAVMAFTFDTKQHTPSSKQGKRI